MAVVGDIDINDVISFSSKLSNDANLYKGKVVGMVTSAVAISYSDILTYNNNVKTIDPTTPDLELLEFMVIALQEPVDNTDRFTVVFAKDWVLESSLNIIATDRIAVLEVFDVDSSDADNIIDLLRSAGFKSRITDLH